MAVFFSLCFYAKAAKMRVAAGDLGDERVTRWAAGGIMRIRLVRKTGMELFAATRKAKRSTRTSVVYIYRLLRQLRRSSFFSVPISILVNGFLYYKMFPNLPFSSTTITKKFEGEGETVKIQKDRMY